MRMAFKVTYDDGREVEAVAKPADIVRFERQFEMPFTGFDADAHLTWLYFLAWSPLERQGRETGTFDEFLGRIDEVIPVDDEEGQPAPFDPAASAEPSAG